MLNKLIVCNECDAEFKVAHTMDEGYYRVEHCVFCGGELSEENKDEVEPPETHALALEYITYVPFDPSCVVCGTSGP